MKISKYVKLGILMIFSISALVWGLSYLKGHDFFKPVDYYYTRYKRIDGLLESGHVTFNGYRVGNVKNIEFADDLSGDLIVTFMINNDFRIPEKSVARIVSSDIMGSRSVKLVFSEENKYYNAGDTIPGEIESDLKEQVSLQVLPLKNKAEGLISSVDSMITVLAVIFNEDARKNLSESFANINQTIRNLERTSSDLQELMAEEQGSLGNFINNMEGISNSLNKNTGHFENIITNLSAFSDTLDALPVSPIVHDMATAVHSLEDLLQKVNNNENTAGLLFNDDELYQNITGLTANLGHLLTDIRSNPKRYLHFSALDLGKEVYVNTTGTPSGQPREIVFRVHLISTTQQLQTGSPLFDGLGEIEEVETSGAFTYLAGQYVSYTEAEKNLNKALLNFPDATIVAFRKGKIISIEKALRSIKK